MDELVHRAEENGAQAKWDARHSMADEARGLVAVIPRIALWHIRVNTRRNGYDADGICCCDVGAPHGSVKDSAVRHPKVGSVVGLHAVPVTGTAVASTGPERERSKKKRSTSSAVQSIFLAERGEADPGSIFGIIEAAETVAGKLSESESEITITLLLNRLGAREDGARDAGTNEARLLGRDPAAENPESPLEGARELAEDPARDGGRELNGVEF
ncbi:hypothetical protein B0H14DRAFT_2568070 [Mycena olivaceomarginata]|nr:hypothetical protein B0H14DRAFT_2568070 [Mycena olivaceomarginata]